MLVTADIAEHLKSELEYYKENYASTLVDAQRNPADPRQHRSFLSVLCICLAAINTVLEITEDWVEFGEDISCIEYANMQEAPNSSFDGNGCGLGPCKSPRTELLGCAYSGDPVDSDNSDDGVLLRGWCAGNIELSAIRRVTFIVRS
jgi:hypothetical protein